VALFRRYFSPEDLVLVEVDGAGNRATYARQIDILLSQTDAELVYFAEDDYVYLPDQFHLLTNFLREREDADFVSPYDHPDCYSLDLHQQPKWVTVFDGHHWRTANSTCLTFLARKSTLAKYESVFRTYAARNDDCAMWLSLTKKRVFDPFALVRYFRRGEFYRRVLVKAWMFCWRQILFGKALKLWVPIPGIATHLSEGLLGTGGDWIMLMLDQPERKKALLAQTAAPEWR
jgi:hypothetical protein